MARPSSGAHSEPMDVYRRGRHPHQQRTVRPGPSAAEPRRSVCRAAHPAGSNRSINEYEVLAAPLDGLADGWLVVRRGLGNVTLVGDGTMADLYTVRCTGRTPRARCTGGFVELTSPLIASVTRPHTDISLNAAVTWAIEVAGEVSDLQADLVQLGVRSVDVDGDVARTVLDLPAPDGTLSVRLGAVRDTTIRRPPGVPARVRIGRGARRVTVDDRRVEAVVGPRTITTPGYDGAADRIEVVVDSAVDLVITTPDLARDVPAGSVEVMAAAHNWFARMRAGGVVWPAPDVA
jgi:hypothetical protein